MPIVNMPLDLLLRLVNRERRILDEPRVETVLHDMGVEVAEISAVRVFACAACENVLERTEAQGEPLSCARCGDDFREHPERCRRIGESRAARLDLLAVRPDLFDVGGMARAVRGFLGDRSGLVSYALAPPKITVKVDPRLADERSFRPCIACAVVRGVRLDHEHVKLVMNMQEDLHWALGRDRKLASIGVYDLDALAGSTYRYDAVAPDALRFVPLGFPPDRPESRLTPGEVLEKHKTGQAYAHLLEGFTGFPLLRDEAGTVLSMPPIINSEPTRVTMRTRELFIDVTGVAQRTVDRALAIIVTGLAEVMPHVEIERVTIDAPSGRLVTPDLTPAAMSLDVATAAATIGVPLDASRLAALLERMGHGVGPGPGATPRTPAEAAALDVRVPAWRNDVMHPIDLIEDAAIAYGYDRLAPVLVPTMTVGSAREIEERSAILRRVLTGLGFHQVMTLPLTSEAAAFDRWRLPRDGSLAARAVRIANPISAEQTMARVSLLPGLLETLAHNKRYDLPQQVFEVGDCCFVDESAETGAREERFVAAAMIGTHAGYADIRAVFDALAHEMGARLAVEPVEHAALIRGRAALLRGEGGTTAGLMGEVHPQVIEDYGLRHPVVVMEVCAAGLAPAPPGRGGGP